MHEFMPLEPFLFFCSKHAQSTTSGLKLKFLVFSHHFGALKCPFGFAPHTLCLKLVFRVVSLHFVAAPDPLLKLVSGALDARVYASKTISCFVATNMPNPLFQSKIMFWVVPCHFIAALDTLQKPVSSHI